MNLCLLVYAAIELVNNEYIATGWQLINALLFLNGVESEKSLHHSFKVITKSMYS